MNRRCDYCGEDITRSPSNFHKQNFCNIKCRTNWQKEHLVGDVCPSWKGGKKTRRCEYCKKDISRHSSRFYKRYFCSRECKAEWWKVHIVGDAHPRWKGGVHKEKGGYLRYGSGKHLKRRVHTVLIEESIGRHIKKGEEVHHINGIRDDNRLENLLLLTHEKHMNLHKRVI